MVIKIITKIIFLSCVRGVSTNYIHRVGVDSIILYILFNNAIGSLYLSFSDDFIYIFTLFVGVCCADHFVV